MFKDPFKKAVEKAAQKGQKIKANLTEMDLDEAVKEPSLHMPNRAQRRERTSKRFWQKRTLSAGTVRKDRKDRWEWKPTQRHPSIKRNENRRKNKAARASRKANRR